MNFKEIKAGFFLVLMIIFFILSLLTNNALDSQFYSSIAIIMGLLIYSGISDREVIK